jgi:hypothetical protein
MNCYFTESFGTEASISVRKGSQSNATGTMAIGSTQFFVLLSGLSCSALSSGASHLFSSKKRLFYKSVLRELNNDALCITVHDSPCTCHESLPAFPTAPIYT